MRNPVRGGLTVALGAGLLALSPGASAQSFGDLTGAIKRNAERSTGGEARPAQPRAQARIADSPAPAAAGPEPWPVNAGARTVAIPHDLDFSPELEAKKKAFVEFSKVRCTSCEGGYSFDAWANLILGVTDLRAWHKRIGETAVGGTLTWRGDASDGTLTVLSDAQVGPFPCKQIRYSLVRRSDKASAERPGLLCFGKASAYAGSPSWVEVL